MTKVVDDGAAGSGSSKPDTDLCWLALATDMATMFAALTVICELGGTYDDELGIVLNGAWCAEQARSALREVNSRRKVGNSG